MILLRSFILAFHAILLRKVKAFLTMLGIIIGVASVIIIFSLSEGAQHLVLDQIRGLGSDLIGVLPGKSEENGPPASAMGIQVTTLTYEDALRMKEDAPSLLAVAPYVKGVGTTGYKGILRDSIFTGTSYMYPDVEKVTIVQGRFFTEQEERGFSNVVVLGYDVYVELFGEGAFVLGERISLKQEVFTVVGVLGKRGVVAFQNQDDQVFLPVTTAQRKLLGISHLGLVRARVRAPEYTDQAIQEVEAILRKNHGIENPEDDDFSVRSFLEALNVLTTVTDALKFFLSAVAAISLLVGGIGIMNIMLMTVRERVKEIGLRKALGAKRSWILFQFLIESVVLSLLGGIFGVLLGIAVSFLVFVVVQSLGYAWIFVVSPFSILLSFMVSVTVGIVFGYYPAREAALLQPIVALRSE